MFDYQTNIEQVVSMGFPRNQAVWALKKANHDISRAIEIIFSDTYPGDEPMDAPLSGNYTRNRSASVSSLDTVDNGVSRNESVVVDGNAWNVNMLTAESTEDVPGLIPPSNPGFTEGDNTSTRSSNTVEMQTYADKSVDEIGAGPAPHYSTLAPGPRPTVAISNTSTESGESPAPSYSSLHWASTEGLPDVVNPPTQASLSHVVYTDWELGLIGEIPTKYRADSTQHNAGCGAGRSGAGPPSGGSPLSVPGGDAARAGAVGLQGGMVGADRAGPKFGRLHEGGAAAFHHGAL